MVKAVIVFAVVAADPAVLAAEPEDAALVHQNRIHRVAGQAVCGREAGEALVVATDAGVGAEPQVALSILLRRPHDVAGETVVGRIRREFFAVISTQSTVAHVAPQDAVPILEPGKACDGLSLSRRRSGEPGSVVHHQMTLGLPPRLRLFIIFVDPQTAVVVDEQWAEQFLAGSSVEGGEAFTVIPRRPAPAVEPDVPLGVFEDPHDRVAEHAILRRER